MSLGPVVAVLAVAEIIVFALVAHATSWWLAILLTLLTSTGGVVLASRTAAHAVRSARASQAGGGPSAALADGAVGLLGCLLLVVPGFITDAVGVLMVFGPTRAVLRRVVGARIAARLVRSRVVTIWPTGRPGRSGRFDRSMARPTTIDGHEIIDADEPGGPDSTTPRPPD